MTGRRLVEWSCAALFVVVAWIALFLTHTGGLGVFLLLMGGWFLFRGYRWVPVGDIDGEFAALLRTM